MEKFFWGQRTVTYTEVKTETLTKCFDKHTIYPVVLAGQVSLHLRCGLLEAENLLERMVTDGDLRHASPEEAKKVGLTFGYVRG